MMVTIVVMMMMGTHSNDHLRLRRIWNCEAEYESQSKQKLFHS